jgi:hypothetical protein
VTGLSLVFVAEPVRLIDPLTGKEVSRIFARLFELTSAMSRGGIRIHLLLVKRDIIAPELPPFLFKLWHPRPFLGGEFG